MPIEPFRIGRTAACLVLGTLLCGPAAVATAQSDANPQPSASAQDLSLVEAGRERFAQACTYCHGKEGVGGKTKAFKGRKDLTADAVFEVISNGRKRGANIMPAWKNSLTESQIHELVAYIISLGNAPAGN